jgi:hypothetical protein
MFGDKKRANVQQTVPQEPEKPYVTVKRRSWATYQIDLFTWRGTAGGRQYIGPASGYWTILGRERAHRKAKRVLGTYLRKHGYKTEPEVRYTAKDMG